MNLMHFEWCNGLYIELEDGDSVRIEDCSPEKYIMLFRNLLCAGTPVINDDLDDIGEPYIKELKEIRAKLIDHPLLQDWMRLYHVKLSCSQFHILSNDDEDAAYAAQELAFEKGARLIDVQPINETDAQEGLSQQLW